MKRSLILSLFALCIIQCTFAQFRLLYSNGSTSTNISSPEAPVKNVEKLADGSIRVTYTFSEAVLIPDNVYSNTYWWKINGFGFWDKAGEAAVPMRKDSYPIPKGKTASVAITQAEYASFNYQLTPARQSLLETNTGGYTTSNVSPVT